MGHYNCFERSLQAEVLSPNWPCTGYSTYEPSYTQVNSLIKFQACNPKPYTRNPILYMKKGHPEHAKARSKQSRNACSGAA